MKYRKSILRIAFTIALLPMAVAFAGGEWSIFSGQVNGPVKNPGGVDLAAFALKKYPGLYWSEGYYHHINFPDGSMITVSIGFNRKETNIAFVYDKPGMEPFHDYVITGLKEAEFDASGFGYTVRKSRIKLDGNKYTLDLEFGKVKAHIVYDIMAPSYDYGDSTIRYPDGDTFVFYNLPIPWAKVHVDAVLDGKPVKLEGSGNMNHDAGVMFPAYTPARWQVFWFFGADHAIAVTDYLAHKKFDNKLTQRLVFADKAGDMFASTDFYLKWDDWQKAEKAPFKYPKHYVLKAEGQGAILEVDARLSRMLLIEDLYSNLPAFMRAATKQITKNVWTADYWVDYTATYSHDGKTDSYKGRGIARWTDYEEEN